MYRAYRCVCLSAIGWPLQLLHSDRVWRNSNISQYAARRLYLIFSYESNLRDLLIDGRGLVFNAVTWMLSAKVDSYKFNSKSVKLSYFFNEISCRLEGWKRSRRLSRTCVSLASRSTIGIDGNRWFLLLWTMLDLQFCQSCLRKFHVLFVVWRSRQRLIFISQNLMTFGFTFR